MKKKNPGHFQIPKLYIVIGLCVIAAVAAGGLLAVFTHREAPTPGAETVPTTAETLPPETEPPTEAPTEPAVDRSDWRLLVVNPWEPLPEDFQVSLTRMPSGHQVDERCFDDLQELMADCRAAGLSPYICSSYRTQEKQEDLYDNKVRRVMNQGYEYEEALEVAAMEVARPGTSEHQLGLAVDIVDKNHIVLDETQADTATQKWLIQHSWEYGFILRYPSEKSDLTGIIFEPWHYRYVGRAYAKEIYDRGICLEEYVGFVYG